MKPYSNEELEKIRKAYEGRDNYIDINRFLATIAADRKRIAELDEQLTAKIVEIGSGSAGMRQGQSLI